MQNKQRYIIEGFVEDQWSWMHVADTFEAALFDKKEDAEKAIESLKEEYNALDNEFRVIDISLEQESG